MIAGIKYCIVAVFLLVQSVSQQQKTILFFGDSITAGNGVNPEQAFPALIEKRFNQGQKPIKAINAGLSGETTAGGLSRIDWVLRQPVDVVVVGLGGNDGLRGLPVDQMEENLQAIIDKVKAKYPNTAIVLAGMMAPPNMGADYTTQFKNVYPTLAKKNNIQLMPFLLEGVAGDAGLNVSDGIHPNPEGHKIIAQNLYTILNDLL